MTAPTVARAHVEIDPAAINASQDAGQPYVLQTVAAAVAISPTPAKPQTVVRTQTATETVSPNATLTTMTVPISVPNDVTVTRSSIAVVLIQEPPLGMAPEVDLLVTQVRTVVLVVVTLVTMLRL